MRRNRGTCKKNLPGYLGEQLFRSIKPKETYTVFIETLKLINQLPYCQLQNGWIILCSEWLKSANWLWIFLSKYLLLNASFLDFQYRKIKKLCAKNCPNVIENGKKSVGKKENTAKIVIWPKTAAKIPKTPFVLKV